MIIGLVALTYSWVNLKTTEKQQEIPKVNIEVDQLNTNLIQALLEDNSALREEQRQKELETLRLAKINEYIKEGNDTLKTVCKLIFGEYSTYLTLTHTEDSKNIIEVGAKFQVAYAVDLLLGEFVYNELEQSIELRLPKASVSVEYCQPISDIVTIGYTKSLLNTLMMPWEVAKREPLRSAAANLLLRDSIDYVERPFEELEQQATYVIEQLLQSISSEYLNNQQIRIVWIS